MGGWPEKLQLAKLVEWRGIAVRIRGLSSGRERLNGDLPALKHISFKNWHFAYVSHVE